jgi:acyl carrier protein
MKLNDIELRVMVIVKEVLVHEPVGLSATTHLVKAGALDSLGVLSISVALEQSFDISLPQQDINPGNFSSVRSIAELMSKKLASKSFN